MRFLRPITIGAILALAQLSAFAGQIAILRNGFSIHFDHREQSGSSTRLYTGTGYLDIASDQIASFDVDETPVTPDPQPAPQPAALITTQPSPAQPGTIASQTPAPAKAAQNVDLDQVVREAS